MTTRRALGAAALTGLLAPCARAQDAGRGIRFVIPYPPGGASDVTARLLAGKLGEGLGTSVVVDNRPGANGIVALEYVAHAPADGSVLLMANLGPNAINATLYRSLPYDPVRSFAPITLTTSVPLLLVVNPETPAGSVGELIALARARPAAITFASAGIGASNHLAGEMFRLQAGIELTHVPYRGDTPAMTDVMGGRVAMMFPTAIAAMPHVRSGRLRVLGITSARRSAALPDVPTVAEGGLPGFDAVSWGGVVAPAGTAAPVVERYHAELARILATPDVRARLGELGAEVIGDGPAAFGAFIRAEIEKWGVAVRASGAVAE